jgi:hypothetical protein
MDPLYGAVAREFGRFRVRRRFIPLRDGKALPTSSDEITLLDESEVELAIVWIPRGSDLLAVRSCLKQWLRGEAMGLAHLEVDALRQRREAAVADGEARADPPEWTGTAEQWAAVYASPEHASAQELARAMWDELEPRLQAQGRSREQTQEYVERLIRTVGEEPDPTAHVVQWWRLSRDERYQRFDLVERGLYDLDATHPERGANLPDDPAASSPQ